MVVVGKVISLAFQRYAYRYERSNIRRLAAVQTLVCLGFLNNPHRFNIFFNPCFFYVKYVTSGTEKNIRIPHCLPYSAWFSGPIHGTLYI